MRIAILALLIATAGNCFAAEEKNCSFGTGTVTKRVAEFQIRISPYRDKDNPDFPQCRAVIRSPDGKVIFSEHDSGFAIALLGEDVNGDGVPDVVLEAYSGGAHCCWTYYIISLGAKPGPLRSFENQLPVSFDRNNSTGRIEISTWDGAFDYFDGVCHPCSPVPPVFLRLDGKDLIDVSSQHLDAYDRVIGERRKALTPEGLQRLRAIKENPSDAEGMSAIVSNALSIVVAYLYSGREAEAHQEVQDMWPTFDQERIWKLILETRENGILSNTRKPG